MLGVEKPSANTLIGVLRPFQRRADESVGAGRSAKNNLENLIKHINGTFETLFEEWMVRPKISERSKMEDSGDLCPWGREEKVHCQKCYGGSGFGGGTEKKWTLFGAMAGVFGGCCKEKKHFTDVMWRVGWRREIKVSTNRHDAVGFLGRGIKRSKKSCDGGDCGGGIKCWRYPIMGVVEWGVRFEHSTLDGEDCGERDPNEMSTNTMEF